MKRSSRTVKEVEEVLPYVERFTDLDLTDRKGYLIVRSKPIVANEDVRQAQAVSSDKSTYEVTFRLKPSGAARFAEWTPTNQNNYLAVALNREIKSVAYIRGKISDSGVISGAFTKETAEDLALVLSSGNLPAPIEVVEERPFGN